jgi:hypothetical protein
VQQISPGNDSHQRPLAVDHRQAALVDFQKQMRGFQQCFPSGLMIANVRHMTRDTFIGVAFEVGFTRLVHAPKTLFTIARNAFFF